MTFAQGMAWKSFPVFPGFRDKKREPFIIGFNHLSQRSKRLTDEMTPFQDAAAEDRIGNLELEWEVTLTDAGTTMAPWDVTLR